MIPALLISSIQPVQSTQFVLSDLGPLDDYGQGIWIIQVRNETESLGSFYSTDHPTHNYSANVVEIPQGENVSLAVFTWVNGTYLGFASLAEGKNLIRHNVSVFISGRMNETAVFSQANFTYVTGTDGAAPMYYYRYDVNLDFVPVGGLIYQVVVFFEVYIQP